MASPQEILDFWFDGPVQRWFTKDPAFDAEILRRFGADRERALRGKLDAWLDEPRSTVALLLLLDQFSRNLFRKDARAFSGDEKALALAREALRRGHDAQLPPLWRWFLYLPFEHSESLADQRLSVRLFDGLPDEEPHRQAKDYARQHLAIIERFGRFPHRNAALGRPSTPEEESFLTQPGSSF